MKKKINARLWLSILWQFRHETDCFKLELSGLTDAELYPGLKYVAPWFLELAPRMLDVTKPKFHPELRRDIAYLADLHERQEAARERQQIRFEQRSRETGRIIKILQNAPMTNGEKINLVKQHYGWE